MGAVVILLHNGQHGSILISILELGEDYVTLGALPTHVKAILGVA